jgi:hypothetical protein
MQTERLIGLFVIAALAVPVSASGDDFRTYEASEHGFTMSIPAGAKVVERERPGGWGGIYVRHDGVEFYGLAKLGKQHDEDEIARFAVKETGIPESRWKAVHSGKGEHGWKWYKIYRADQGDKVVFGASGVGPKGSYLLFVRTTKSDFSAHEAAYEKWVESIRLH